MHTYIFTGIPTYILNYTHTYKYINAHIYIFIPTSTHI